MLDDIRKTWDAYIDCDDETISAAAERIEQQLEIERCRQGTTSTAQSVSGNTVYGGSNAVSSSVASGSQSSQADMSRRLKELEKERKALTYQMGRRLNRRYTTRSRSTTTIGVIGTGLAVGQLVAAIACVVM
jgi:hypothetical protein